MWGKRKNRNGKAPGFTCILFLWYTFFSALLLQARNITVRDIPLLDQLPVNAIHRIFQDSEGYMWYGTVDGLCRDDGYSIRTFRSDFNHPGVMSMNSITCIAEDRTGKIWFGTRKGAYILDKSTYTISPVPVTELSDRDITFITSTSEGSVWIGAQDFLLRICAKGTVSRYSEIAPGEVALLYEDRNRNILFTTSENSIYKLNRKKNTFEPFFVRNDLPRINCIIQDKDHDYYWISTWGKGIARFDPGNPSEDLRYVPQPLPVNAMQQTDGTVLHMAQDDALGYLWVTSATDLFAFRITDEGNLKQIDTSPFIAPCNKMLNEILKDKAGNLWVSAFDRKSFIIRFGEDERREYPLSILGKRIKSNPAIVTLCRDEDGIFWFSQERVGLCMYDPEKELLKYYSDSPGTRNLPLWTVPYLIKSRTPRKVWAMTYGTRVFGISRHQTDFRLDEEIDLKAVSAHSGVVETVYEDAADNLWIGTMSGLYVYRIKTGTLEIVSENMGTVSDLVQTKRGTIWATVRNKGVCRIDPGRNIKLYPLNKDFLCIDADREGQLWMGTGEGEVLMLDPRREEPRFTDYSLWCGMNGDMVDNIQVDKYNHIWIVTNQRIKEFNPRNNAYRSLDASDPGLLLNRFLPRSLYEEKDGYLYFGGIPGILAIPPSLRLESVPKQVKVHLTNIKLMGRSILFDPTAAPHSPGRIEVQAEEQNLEIEFSSLDYQHTGQIRYAYRLNGVDQDWVYLPAGKNTAFYNKLDKGSYVFQVKATDENGLWSDQVTEITIRRLPALYETWWAYLCYFLVAGGILGTIAYLYFQRLKQENSRKLSEEMMQVKLSYFTNISHELLTPLTILSCVAEEISAPDEAGKKRITLLQSNILRLKRLLQQVLDFKKIETRRMKLFVSCGNLSSFVRDICETGFLPLARKREIQFLFTSPPQEIRGYFDPDKLDKILFNLLSNAFKYTPPGGKITLNLDVFKAGAHIYARIGVKDTGIGIAPRELDRIFTRFYSYKANDAGLSNGIGLSLTKELAELHHGTIRVESQYGKGAEFCFEFPLEEGSYSPYELKEASSGDERNITLLKQTLENLPEEAPETLKHEYTLLLVEDNEELLLVMKSLFVKSYRVLTAGNGKEALECVRKEDVDVVISDIMMPEMNGLELCKAIKNEVSTSHIIVILLTAKTTVERQVDSYRLEADDYLSKPFEASVLKARLENLLRKRETRQAQFKHNPRISAISDLGLPSLDEELIAKALGMVETHLSDPAFDVSVLADKLYMSRSTFSRKIKAVTGQTPLDFIKNIKMQHACRMLSNKTITVSEVIIALGYSDHKHFTNSFKEAFGVTPSEYQRKNGS